MSEPAAPETPEVPAYDPSASYPHLNGDGYVSIPSWTANTFTIRGRVTPTVAGTRVLVGEMADTDNYISLFGGPQRLGVKLGGGTAVYIEADYLNAEMEFTLVFNGTTGTLTWGGNSVEVTPGANPIAFDSIGRNSISFSPYDGWYQELDLTDDGDSSNSRSYYFATAGEVTDSLGDGSTDGTLNDGLDATDWSTLP